MDDLRQGILEIFAEAGQADHGWAWSELEGKGHHKGTWSRGMKPRRSEDVALGAPEYGRKFGPGWYARLSEPEKEEERKKRRGRYLETGR